MLAIIRDDAWNMLNMRHINQIQKDRIIQHDNAIKWKHFPRYWPFVQGIHRSPANSPHKDQWRKALMFSLICAWINDWVNKLWSWWFEADSSPLCHHNEKSAVVVGKDYIVEGDHHLWKRPQPSPTYAQKTLHNWPIRVRFIVSFTIPVNDL